MDRYRCARLAPLLLAALLLGAAPAPDAYSGDLELDATRPYVVALINGTPFRLRVDLDAQGAVVLNPEAARRAGFGRSGTVIMNIGPVKFAGRHTRSTLAIDGRRLPVPVKWFVRRAVDDADGLVTPALLPFASVTLGYGDATAPSRGLAFRTSLEEEAGLHIPLRVGGQLLKLRFSPRGETVATAAAAAVLARSHGAGWDGDQKRIEIGYGVQRPARPLRLRTPLQVGELTVGRLMARLADFAGRHELPDEADTTAPAEEILVRARRPTQAPVYRMTLGRETLGGCHAATVRPGTGELILACGPDPDPRLAGPP